MKKFILITAIICLCTAAFAKPPKIKDSSLVNEKYIYKLADQFGVKDIYDDDFCFFGANKQDGTCVFFYTQVYSDGRFTYGFANNGSEFVSYALLSEKNKDKPIRAAINESQSMLGYVQSDDIYLTEYGKAMYTSIIAALRADCIKNYPEAQAMLPAYAKERNAEILKTGMPQNDKDIEEIISILKKYNK